MNRHVGHESEVTTIEMEVTEDMRERARKFVNEKQFRHTETGVFVTPDAEDAKTFYQIAMNSSKDPNITVEDADEDAYEVDGQVYRHVELSKTD
ncbi:MAG: hypothetical protein J07HQX50_01640 [Haloquadratum sp. J07HQX50]|jgi:hypothetical protein|nr:MAG: hypothetical protein J07HQX50_01640 [Haloquadratum sp. J07HQX50]